MSFARELDEASSEWVAEGLITAEVRQRLLERHPVVPGRSRVVAILAGIGGLTLAAGILLLVAANWEAIPRYGKLGGAATVMTAAFALGYWVRFGRGLRRTGEAIILVGSGAFLGNLALVSQQYHIMANPTLLLFVFFASMIPLLYLLRSRTYALFTPLAGLAWTSALLANEDSRLHADEFAEVMIFLTGIGAGIVAIGTAHRFSRLASLAAPIEVAGGALLLGAVFALGFYRYETPDADAGRWGLATFVGPAALSIPALTALGVLRIRKPEVQIAVIGAAAILAATLAWCLLVGLNPRSSHDDFPGRSSGEEAFALYTGGFWIAFIALTAALAWLAFVTRRDWWLNVSLVAIGAFLIARYFDMFAETENRGLVFVGGGLLLLILAGVLERSRRMIASARGGEQ